METPEDKPLFTLTAEELEIVRKADTDIYVLADPEVKPIFIKSNRKMVREIIKKDSTYQISL
ncbi:MAG: hypothetical protein J1E95_04315 [Muribaculaceae bacterium]|nr:hypothetical protein [Muribaculaceae bacterium]